MRILILLLCLTGTAWGGVYKCVKDGETTYSQRPCGGEQTVIEIKSAPVEGDSRKAAEERRASFLKSQAATALRIKKRNLNLRIIQLKADLDGLIGKRDSQIEVLHKKLLDVYDFRHKALVESQISEVRDKYWRDRSKLERRLSDARTEMIMLR